MRKVWIGVIALSATMFAGAAVAGDALALANKKGCMACHKVDQKVVGPAWNDVAAKVLAADLIVTL